MRFKINGGRDRNEQPVPVRLRDYPEGLSVQVQTDCGRYWTTILKLTPHGEIHRVAKDPQVMRLLQALGFRFDSGRRIQKAEDST